MRLILLFIAFTFVTTSFAQKYLNDPRLFEVGERVIYSGRNLTNISFPMGGIGGGCINIDGNGERSSWQIFNNFSQAKIPQSFFAIQAKANGEAPITKQLQTTSGAFSPIDSLTFEGEYPLGWYHFYDDDLPVSVEMEVFSPFIPLDAKSSAIPCAIYTIKATNNSNSIVDVNVLATQKNPIGHSGFPIYSEEVSQLPNQGNILEDFEDDTYDKWTKTGNAFGNTPASSGINGFTGNYLVKSSNGGKGTLTFNPFTINKRYLYFQINGARDFNNQHRIGIGLLINDSIVQFASGHEQNFMYWDFFDLEDYQGQIASILIIDDFAAKSISIDHIFESDEFVQPTAGTIFEDFENSTELQNWIKTGNAFNVLPSTGSAGIQTLKGFIGNGLINTFDNGNIGSDNLTGTFTSPEFVIDNQYLYFLIGGGSTENTSINLIIDNIIVETASGNERDIMAWKFWNTGAYLGQTAKIQILDQSTGAWGHIVIDQIVFSDESLSSSELVGVGQNINHISTFENATLLQLTAENNAADMVLFTKDEDAIGSSDIGNINSFVNSFSVNGNLPPILTTNASLSGATYTGAINVPKTLAPGESCEITYVLTWSFPDINHGLGDWSYQGNKYNFWWNNARDVAEYTISNLEDLEANTKNYHQAVYESNLPHYVLDRITSQTAILKAKTAFWAKNDVYANWEGLYIDQPLGEGSCNHVVHYAQAHARLFPTLAKSRRASAFSNQKSDGGFAYRQPNNFSVFDGQCGEILSCYREHLLNNDNQWLTDNWDNIKDAMNYVITRWDNDQDGLMSGPQWNTLDANLGGVSSWMGTMYLAALKASAKMANIVDDQNSYNLFSQIYDVGALAQDNILWNGEYYIQINEETPQRDYLTGCALDQLLGEYWINQVGLPKGIYNTDRTKQALQAIYQYNFRDSLFGYEQLPRKFLDDSDGGFQMITWPNGGRPNVFPYYASEVMSGFEYSTIATMINYDLMEEGFSALLAIFDRYNGKKREQLSPWIWEYSGNPFGDDEWGKWYYRAMSSWSILIASQGFIYDGPNQKIGFKPKWQPENHSSFFTTSEGWGVFSQQKDALGLTATIDLRYGQLDVNSVLLEIDNLVEESIIVTVNNVPNIPFTVDGNSITILLNSTESIIAGESINISINGQTTSVNEQVDKDNRISIYPNPVIDQLNISALEMIEKIEVYNSVGKLVIAQNPNDFVAILNCKNLATGNYLITIKTKTALISKEILVVIPN